MTFVPTCYMKSVNLSRLGLSDPEKCGSYLELCMLYDFYPQFISLAHDINVSIILVKFIGCFDQSVRKPQFLYFKIAMY